MSFERTRALLADTGKSLGITDLSPDPDGACRLTFGEDTEILLFGVEDETLLVAAAIAPLPTEPEYSLVNYLFRQNFYTADSMPFVVAVDPDGWLVLWGRLRIADFTGESLGTLVDAVARLVDDLRDMIAESTGGPTEKDGQPLST